MNSRWATIVAATLAAFASLVIAWQFKHCHGAGNGPYGPYSSLAQSFLRGNKLPGLPISWSGAGNLFWPRDRAGITI